MKTTALGFVVAVALVLAGCGGDEDTTDNVDQTSSTTEQVAEPSEDCLRNFRTASLTDNPDAYGPQLDESLTTCETVDQWIAGLKRYPEALGISGPEFVDAAIELRSVCTAEMATTPVCSEAIGNDLIPAPATTTTPTTTTRPLDQFPRTGDEEDVLDALGSACEPEGHRVEGPIAFGDRSLSDGVRCTGAVWAVVSSLGYGCYSDDVNEKPIVAGDGSPLACADGQYYYTDRPRDAIHGTGNFRVGQQPQDIAPGTWITTDAVEDCYWERVDSNGRTIENDFVVGAPTVRVTISASDAGFNTDGCGGWALEA